MADDDPERQRLEDMLKASEQRRKPGPGARGGAGGEATPSDRPTEDTSGDDAEGEDGSGRPPRATGSASTMVKTGLVLGPLSILVGFLVLPIVGLLLGIAAIVLGVLVSRRAADVRAKIALGLGILGVIASIASFAIVTSTMEGDDDSGDSEEEEDDGDSDSEDDGDSGGDDGDSNDGNGNGDGSSSMRRTRVVATKRCGELVLRPT